MTRVEFLFEWTLPGFMAVLHAHSERNQVPAPTPPEPDLPSPVSSLRQIFHP